MSEAAAIVPGTTTSEAVSAPNGEGSPPPSPEGAGAASGAAAEQKAEQAEDSLAKAKSALAKAKRGAERNSKLRAQVQAAEREVERSKYEAQQARAYAEQQRLEREALRSGDIKRSLAALGYSTRQISEMIAKEGTPEAAFDAIRAELGTTKEELNALKQQLAMERQQVSYKAAAEAFMNAASDATKYPTLANQPRGMVLAAAKQLIQEAKQKTGFDYSNGEVLDFLEQHWSGHQKARQAKQDANGKASTASAPKENTAAPPRTITNGIGKPYALPANFEELDDQQQKAAMAAALTAVHRKP